MNHSFATSQRVLTGDVLHEALLEINQRRFAFMSMLWRSTAASIPKELRRFV